MLYRHNSFCENVYFLISLIIIAYQKATCKCKSIDIVSLAYFCKKNNNFIALLQKSLRIALKGGLNRDIIKTESICNIVFTVI